MLPIDDPSWPVCSESGCNNEGGKGTGWCNHIRDSFIAGEDASSFQPGMNYCIPVVAEYNLYAEVNLGTDLVAEEPRMVELSLLKPKADVFGLDAAEMIPLGLHVAGEGRLEIGHTIAGWIDSSPLTECKYHKHSYNQEMHVQSIARHQSPLEVKAMGWCLAYYEMCWPCRIRELNPGTAPTPPSRFDAGSFGLDNTVTDPDAAKASAAASALADRFRNRG